MISRVLPLYKPLLQQFSKNVGRNVVRGGHIVCYRSVQEAPKANKIGAEIVSAGMWWWILWHLWHEHEHITGEFPYPDTDAWTNKELGIPS